MKTHEQGFRHFDLPVDHLPVGETAKETAELGHWIPPQCDNPNEIKLVQPKPTLLIARRQNIGTLVQKKATQLAPEDSPDEFFELLGAASFNAAFYEHAREPVEDVSRRRLFLTVATKLGDGALTRSVLLEDIDNKLDALTADTGLLAAHIQTTRGSAVPSKRRSVGVQHGNIGIEYGAVPKTEQLSNAWDETHAQSIVRAGAMAVRNSARIQRNGAYVSVAQAADRYSPLSTHIINNQSKYSIDARKAFMDAQDEVLEAAHQEIQDLAA